MEGYVAEVEQRLSEGIAALQEDASKSAGFTRSHQLVPSRRV